MVDDRNTIEPIILMRKHDVIGIKWTSPKTSQKSLEQGVLWEVHPCTKKEIELLPPVYINRIVKKDGWYIAHLDEHKQVDNNEITSLMPLDIKKEKREKGYRKTETSSAADAYNGLSMLHDIIKERKKLLPEGSYTTHLFNSGDAKIKKKIGEEAIELILSQKKEDIINEGADLLYHFFVMLVNEDINPKSVMGELLDRLGV